MSIFKKSYARGVADTLIRAGLAKFASVEQAQEVADYVGEQFDVEPTTGQIPAEKCAEVAVAIIEVAEKLAGGTSTLITGGNASQANTPGNAAQHNALAALDEKNRPQGSYAKGEKGVGQTDFKAPAAAQVGVEQAHPHAPGTTDQKANSVNTFQVKGASLRELIQKVASGTGNLVTGNDASQANTPSNAAQSSATAALDEQNRPQGTYAKGEKGVGDTDLKASGSAVVGSEQPHEKAPGKTDSGSNSVTEQSKAASYTARFEETAREYLPQLPNGLSDDEKVAAVKTLMGLDPEEARDFLARGGKK